MNVVWTGLWMVVVFFASTNAGAQTSTSRSFTPAVIFENSNTVKALRPNLNLDNSASILTGTDDPSVVAKNAPQGSLYLRIGPTGGQTYVKQDAGLSTNWLQQAGGGSVASVGLSLPSIFTVTGSPVTSAGTLTGTLANQAANSVWAGPASGPNAPPSFRALQAGDLPGLPASQITSGQGSLTTATTGVTITTGTNSLLSSAAIDIATASGSSAGLLSSADWTTFNGKQASGSYITGLIGDVTASGPGSASATVAQVGGETAANVASATGLALAATDANTLGAIVKRDGSGNFAAGTITATLTGTASNTTALQGVAVAATAPTNGYVLKYNSGSTQWEPAVDAGGGANTALSNIASTEMPASLRWRAPDDSNQVYKALEWLPEAPYTDPVASIEAERTDSAGAPTDIIFKTTDNHPTIYERMRITGAGLLSLGTTTAPVYGGGAANESTLTINAVPPSADPLRGMFTVADRSALAAGVGGDITFAGVYNAGNDVTFFSQVKGYKENATDGEFGGGLSFSTRPDTGTLIERMKIDPAGKLFIKDPSLGAASVGYVWTLQNTGTGEGAWAVAPASQWSSVTGGIAYSSAVSIGGTQDPVNKLSLWKGTMEMRTDDGANGDKGGMIWVSEDPFQDAMAYFHAERTGGPGAPTDLVFETTDSAPSITPRLRILSTGESDFQNNKVQNVESLGIGIAAPTSRLHMFNTADEGWGALLDNTNTGSGTNTSLVMNTGDSGGYLAVYTTGFANTPLQGRTILGSATGSGIWIKPGIGHDLILGANDVEVARVVTTGIDMQANKITDLGTPTASTDAATKGYVDSVAGGANTTLSNLTSPTAINQQLLFTNTLGILFQPADSSNGEKGAIRWGPEDPFTNDVSAVITAERTDSSGAPMDILFKTTTNNGTPPSTRMRVTSAGVLSMNGGQIDMNTARIVDVGNPTSAQDAATKGYVDGTVVTRWVKVPIVYTTYESANPQTPVSTGFTLAANEMLTAYRYDITTEFIGGAIPGGSFYIDLDNSCSAAEGSFGANSVAKALAQNLSGRNGSATIYLCYATGDATPTSDLTQGAGDVWLELTKFE
jgi:hypothetical protein